MRTIVDLIAGIVIIAVPEVGEFAIALIFGLWLILRGMMEIVASLVLRKLAKQGDGPGDVGSGPPGPPLAPA